MTPRDHRHAATLDALRAELVHALSLAWRTRLRVRLHMPRHLENDRQNMRALIARCRALDAVRAAANEAELKLRLWERHEKRACPIIAACGKGSGRW